MITEERLQKLIDRGATIYYDTSCESMFSSRESQLYLSPLTFDIKGDYLVNYYVAHIGPDETVKQKRNDYPLRNLYEKKKDWKWEMEFGNVSKKEKLYIPKFEELPENLTIPFLKYDTKLETWLLFQLYVYNGEVLILFRELLDDANDCLYHELLTKKSYVKALRMLKKLFLGE